jgi:soluble cytochrome b562
MIKFAAITLCCLLSLLSISRADTPLENSMKRLAKATKQLSLDLKAPVDVSKPDYLALTATMKTEVQKSRALVPQKAAALPADQQATMVAAYQKSMDDLGTTIDTLSQAIQAGQWDAARTAMAKIFDQEKEGHKEFRNQDKKGPYTTIPPTTATPPPAAPLIVTPSQQAIPPQTAPPAQ